MKQGNKSNAWKNNRKRGTKPGQLIKRSQSKLDAFEEERGSDVEMKAEKRKQRQLIKNYITDLESK